MEGIIPRQSCSGAYWEERLLKEEYVNIFPVAHFKEGRVLGTEPPAVPLADAQLVCSPLTDGVGVTGRMRGSARRDLGEESSVALPGAEGWSEEQ